MNRELPRSIFVVDDSEIIAGTLALVLERSGFVAKAFFNGIAALTAAQTAPPDLLISDIIMPDMNGVDLAIEFATAHPECKTLLLPGHPDGDKHLRKAKEMGFEFELIAKPAHPSEIMARIRALFRPIRPVERAGGDLCRVDS